MTRILVSLVSEQTLPNVVMAAHTRPDEFLFLTTEKGETRGWSTSVTDALFAMGVIRKDTPVRRISLEEHSFSDCLEKISAFVDSHGSEADFTVNITGGTKIMALAAFDVFRDLGSKILYLPLGSNRCVQIFPRKRPLHEFDISIRLSVEQYLLAYGYRILNKKAIGEMMVASRDRKGDTAWVLSRYEGLKGLLGFLYKNIASHQGKKSFVLSAPFDRAFSPVEREFLRRFGFSVKGSLVERSLTKREAGYFCGKWLEEHVFHVVSGLVDSGLLDDAMLGVNIQSLSGNDNDLDVVFTKDNVFYHLECKTLGEKTGKEIIAGEIYKKGALSTLLGRGERRGYVCTTRERISEAQKRRAREYGLEVLCLEELRNLENLLRERFEKGGT